MGGETKTPQIVGRTTEVSIFAKQSTPTVQGLNVPSRLSASPEIENQIKASNKRNSKNGNGRRERENKEERLWAHKTQATFARANVWPAQVDCSRLQSKKWRRSSRMTRTWMKKRSKHIGEIQGETRTDESRRKSAAQLNLEISIEEPGKSEDELNLSLEESSKRNWTSVLSTLRYRERQPLVRRWGSPCGRKRDRSKTRRSGE